MSETMRHKLPLLTAGQAQKEVTHNESIMHIDRLLHPAALSRMVTTPAPSPQPGDTYIIPAAASGAWAGPAGRIATHDGFGWVFTIPDRGCLAWIVDEQGFALFDGTAWTDGFPVNALRIDGRKVLGAAPVTISAPVGGAIVDVEARAAIAAIAAVLRTQAITI